MSDVKKPVRAIYCDCAYTDLAPDSVKTAARQAVAASGIRFEAVPDLCALAARRDPRLTGWFATGPVLVLACYPRTIRWLLKFAGIDLSDDSVRSVNVRTTTADDLAAILPPTGVAPASIPDLKSREEWVPWFPVLDYDRCNQCRQCLSFCPFGVYELVDKRVVVKNPIQCKNNCPACARICPQVAIVFPKVKDSPINGAEVTPEDVARQRKSAVEGETDLHALLARRRMRAAAGRFARNLAVTGPAPKQEQGQ